MPRSQKGMGAASIRAIALKLGRLSPKPWYAFGFAVATVVAATILNLIAWPGGTQEDEHYFALIAAVLLTALSVGPAPGLVATALGGFSSAYFSLVPQFSVRVEDLDATKRLFVFLLEGVVLSVVAGFIRTSEEVTSEKRRLVANFMPLGCSAVAILLKELVPRIGDELPFAFNYAAICVSARVGGVVGGVVATAALALSTRYLFLEPRYSLALANGTAGIRVGLFFVEGLLLSLLGGAYVKLRRTAVDLSERVGIYMDSALRRGAEIEAIRAVSRDTIWEWDVDTAEMFRTPSWQDRLSIALPVREDFTSWVDRIHPDDRIRTVENLKGALKNAKEELQYDYRLRALDGAYLPVSEHAFIVRDDDGKPLRVIGRSTEFAGASLPPWKEHPLERIFAESPAAMIVTDSDLRIVQANSAARKMFGIRESRIHELRLLMFVDPLSRPYVFRRLAPLLRREHLTISFEHNLIRQTGDPFHARLLVTVANEFQSHSTGCLIAIEELKRRGR